MFGASYLLATTASGLDVTLLSSWCGSRNTCRAGAWERSDGRGHALRRHGGGRRHHRRTAALNAARPCFRHRRKERAHRGVRCHSEAAGPAA